MIKFGVMSNSHPASAADLSRLVDEMVVEAQQAEKYGFDSFFVTEHHQEPSGYLPSPLPLLAALATRSRTSDWHRIAVLPRYHRSGWHEDCASSEIISKGGQSWGVGMGTGRGLPQIYGSAAIVSGACPSSRRAARSSKRRGAEEKLYFVGSVIRSRTSESL